jgi:hypothetical protein
MFAATACTERRTVKKPVYGIARRLIANASVYDTEVSLMKSDLLLPFPAIGFCRRRQ